MTFEIHTVIGNKSVYILAIFDSCLILCCLHWRLCPIGIVALSVDGGERRNSDKE